MTAGTIIPQPTPTKDFLRRQRAIAAFLLARTLIFAGDPNDAALFGEVPLKFPMGAFYLDLNSCSPAQKRAKPSPVPGPSTLIATSGLDAAKAVATAAEITGIDRRDWGSARRRGQVSPRCSRRLD